MAPVTVKYPNSNTETAMLCIDGYEHNGTIMKGIGTGTIEIPIGSEDLGARELWNNSLADIYPSADHNGNHTIILGNQSFSLHPRLMGPLVEALTDYFFETDLAALCK